MSMRRLGAAALALWPIALAGWLGAGWSRRRLAQPDRVRRALAACGIATAGRRIACRPLGHGEMNAVLLVTLDGGERVVLKHALRFGTFLGWAAREFGAMCQYPRALGRQSRHRREVHALAALRGAGVAVPRCLGASDRDRVIALEWVDGPDLAGELARRPTLAGELGRLLARIHAAGLALGDANPRNFAVTAGDRIVPFDLEVSHDGATDAQQGFDLAWAAAFLPDAATREAFFAAYGPRSTALADAVAAADAHLAGYRPLIDLYARRWREAA